ncbi:Regulator of autolytic activity [Actinomyces bovis]|uniref:Regulator of autolytic activity n=1 Tax=Actinomyces bovis TaxID=1658 RepID=A0ABY1VR96_9ACTO|nr:MarR family transcriptional regulator [Actinomyces bovis]SPT53952.1 Regulator of autolytic activity [Actinomyces bovis]VEG53471.1 Regulator of autolytic activity [Actinomyces israelii]
MDTIQNGIRERLHRLHKLMRRNHMQARHNVGPLADTSRGRGRVLAALQMQSPIPTRELAYLLDIRQQSLNELLKKLEADGLIERKPSDVDRRIMLISLTPEGAKARLGNEGDDYLQVLSQEEAVQLNHLLDKVIGSLEEQLGVDADEELGGWREEARRFMGEEGFEAMMRMRERGFGPGPFGSRHHGGHGFGPQGKCGCRD